MNDDKKRQRSLRIARKLRALATDERGNEHIRATAQQQLEQLIRDYTIQPEELEGAIYGIDSYKVPITGPYIEILSRLLKYFTFVLGEQLVITGNNQEAIIIGNPQTCRHFGQTFRKCCKVIEDCFATYKAHKFSKYGKLPFGRLSVEAAAVTLSDLKSQKKPQYIDPHNAIQAAMFASFFGELASTTLALRLDNYLETHARIEKIKQRRREQQMRDRKLPIVHPSDNRLREYLKVEDPKTLASINSLEEKPSAIVTPTEPSPTAPEPVKESVDINGIDAQYAQGSGLLSFHELKLQPLDTNVLYSAQATNWSWSGTHGFFKL